MKLDGFHVLMHTLMSTDLSKYSSEYGSSLIAGYHCFQSSLTAKMILKICQGFKHGTSLYPIDHEKPSSDSASFFLFNFDDSQPGAL
jgi:hypothetical protein